MKRWVVTGSVLALAGSAGAQAWQDATPDCLGTTAEWSNKVEVADVDGDGLVDLLIANGGGYATPGAAEPSRVWKNLGGWGTPGAHCMEISAQALGGFTGRARVIKAIDVDGDGALDLLLADWGATSPGAAGYPGGRTRLYHNNGQGTFTDVTATQMPDLLVKWSWDVELADLDGDWDLDALVACKLCATSYVFRNDGSGRFTEDSAALPAAGNTYDFEPLDLDGDGDLDLVTVNDGPQLRERILINDGQGVFSDETSTRLAGTANPANADDNVAVWLDVDGDADPDLLIGGLGAGADRLLLNDNGAFTLAPASTPADTPGTLGLAAADLDGDGRLDLLHGQGEAAFADKIQLATQAIAVDPVPPRVVVEDRRGSSSVGVIHARVDDYQSPSRAHDFQRVWLEHDGYAARVTESAPPPHVAVEMTWIGGYLWAAPSLAGVASYRACATDRRNNSACTDWVYVYDPGGGGAGPDAGLDGPGPGSGGCCDAGSGPGSGALAWVLLVTVRRRRRQCQRPIDATTLR